MTLTSSSSLDPVDGEAKLWGLSLAVVAAAHALPLIALGLWLRPTVQTPPPPPSAVMIDMTPAEQPKPAPPQQEQPKPQHIETRAPPAQPTVPKVPVVANAAVNLASEPPRPAAAPAQQASSAPAQAVQAPAPPPPALSSNALPTWQGQVLGRLERFKRYPEEARFHHQEGVAYLRFSINRDGKLLSASIDKGSGNALLDAEALALAARAQPYPRPPADVPGDRLELVAPVEFSLTRSR